MPGSDEITKEMDEQWQRMMDRALRPPPDANAKRLYMIARRAALWVIAAFDAYYGVNEPRLDKPQRKR